MLKQKKEKKEADLGKDPVGKLLFKLSVPAITAQIVNVLYNMVDRMYIGHIEGVGAAALTGVGVCLPIIMAVSAFASLVAAGGATNAAIYMGKKDKDKAERILGNCTAATFISGILLTIVLLVFGEDLLMMFGASANTIGFALDYMRIYAIGTLFVEIALGLNFFISSQGFANVSMISVIIGAVSNIILDPILIFGAGMGVKGAALATIISQGISAVWVLCFLFGKRTQLKIKVKNLVIDWPLFGSCLALGMSPFIMQITESIISVCFNSSLLKYGGDIAVGAMTILSSVMQFSMLPLQGLTQGAQPIVSFNYGAGDLHRVKQAFFLLLKSCIFYSTLLWAIAMFFPQVFVSIFTADPELAEFTRWALRIYMAVSLIFGIQIACQQTFIALGNAKASLFLAVLRKIILLIPLILILPHFFANKVMAVYLAEPVADTIAVLSTGTLFFFEFRKLLREHVALEK